MTKKTFWEKHKFETGLALVTLLAGAVIAYYESDYFAKASEVEFDSGIAALSHQASALNNGLSSNVTKTPNGTFSNNDGTMARATIHMSASANEVINCGHGLVFNTSASINCTALVANLTLG